MNGKSIELMHSAASGVPGPRLGKEWLNSVPVVDRLVRQFFANVLGRIGRLAINGKKDALKALAKIRHTALEAKNDIH